MSRRTRHAVTVAITLLAGPLASLGSPASASPTPPLHGDTPVPRDGIAETGAILHEMPTRHVPEVQTTPFGGTWSSLGISGRSGQAAVIDPSRHRMIVFGGRNHLGSRADLWELTLGAPTRWRRLVASGEPPPPMDRMSMVLDPGRDRLIVYGGRDSTARDSCDHPTCRTFGAAWTLDLGRTPRWSELRPSGIAPAPRSGHIAVYDPRTDCMVVFGGERVEEGACPCDGRAPELLRDAWALRLRGRPRWEPILARGAPPASSARGSAFYDPALDRMVYLTAGDTLFSLSLGRDPTWSEQATTSFFPPRTSTLEGRTRAAYDGVHDALFLFREMSVYRLPLHGDAEWRLFAGGPPWYEPVIMHSRDLEDFSLVFDERTSSLVTFGGATSNLGLTIRWAAAVPTTQAFSAWSMLGPGEPPSLPDPQLVFDPHHRREIVVGAPYGTEMKVWSLDVERDPPWSGLVPAPQPSARPQVRSSPGLVLDSGRGRLVMFGGLVAGQGGLGCPEGCPPALGDAWAFDLEDSRWDPIVPSGDGPSPRATPMATCDAERDRVLLVGGFSYDHPVGVDTLWSLSLAAAPRWTALPIRGPFPPHAYGDVAAFDSRRGRFLTTIGWSPTELWALDLGDSPHWEDLGSTALPPGVLLYDPDQDRLLDISQGDVGRPMGGIETWTRDLATGREARADPDTPADADSPPARLGYAAVLEPANRRVALFGGYTGVARGQGIALLDFLTDTWFLDLGGPVEKGHAGDRAGGTESLMPDAEGAPAIGGARFDVASGTMRVTFTAPGRMPARVALYDVAGRRVAAADARVGAYAPQEIALPLAVGLRSGVYFVLVSQGARTSTARAIVVR